MVIRYGSCERWQELATHSWIEKLSKLSNKKLVFLEGSFNPEFATTKMQKLGIKNFFLICIHTDRVVREKRLTDRRMQPELATQQMENFALMLKEKTTTLGGVVIHATNCIVS
jgi:hypothetical protein